MDTKLLEELTTLIDNWDADPNKTKECFTGLKDHLEGLDGVNLDFVARPGITYSLRAAHAKQTKRSLFAMVDVIDDDPADRWLSVCFYKELVSDPDELGDEVPGGLLGEDACCFDVDAKDDALMAYIKDRLSEACEAASKEA
ncbi:hypothetical protein [Pseudodesulfovibrio sediminis]|uniref:DUF5655 domain-containing protein n=1 Tax=Pseudodesulfovibrio sediminis TaxID=2810563 RepID=A0ABM7P951_9BACT|nr:hypothetical protein [Pseudodesulfovibrio sediminis]BCS89587.1 hypothetical protein PSDVSF_28290 [Pseudodesulfovibrio sediminis]